VGLVPVGGDGRGRDQVFPQSSSEAPPGREVDEPLPVPGKLVPPRLGRRRVEVSGREELKRRSSIGSRNSNLRLPVKVCRPEGWLGRRTGSAL
jgi:hypothetical protein